MRFIYMALFFCCIGALVGLSSTIKCYRQSGPNDNRIEVDCNYQSVPYMDPNNEYQFCGKNVFAGNGSLIALVCGGERCSYLGNGCKKTTKGTYEVCCCDNDLCNDSPALSQRYITITATGLLAAYAAF
jgi:hypothetical protein